MNKAQKLLYILPDLAYTAELLPTKKPNVFTIKDFHQINGELIKDDQFIEKNLSKLAEKIEKGDYQLVLPDFLFTNTIVNVEESSEAKVKEVLKTKLLPELGLDTKSHYLETFILTKHKGVFKVQLSALEKSVIEPLKEILAKEELGVVSIMPLSWTVKSVVSLEPSITVLELGNNLYLAEQYIGMDQCTRVEVSETDKLTETIKTLKGSEASIQTVYLLTSDSVEEKLKKNLTDILPLQQLTLAEEGTDQIPAFVKQIIEAAAKTTSIPDYLMPQFSVGQTATRKIEEDKEVDLSDIPAPAVIDADNANSGSLPQPTKLGDEKGDEDSDFDDEEPEEEQNKAPLFGEEEEDKKEDKDDDDDKEDEAEEKKEEDYTEVDLSQFAGNKEDKSEDIKEVAGEEKKQEKSTQQKMEVEIEKHQDNKEEKVQEEKKDVIKNKSGVNGMLKMFFIGLVSFFVTIALGLAIGLGYLSFSSKQAEKKLAEEAATAEVEQVATPTPTPTPVPIDKEELSILVVNATKIAGHAGETSSKLEEAGYGSTKAANASGEYDEGYFVLMKEENADLITALKEDTDLDLVYSSEIETEDATDKYDAVIVLAE